MFLALEEAQGSFVYFFNVLSSERMRSSAQLENVKSG